MTKEGWNAMLDYMANAIAWFLAGFVFYWVVFG
jgi:hypothetical protein